MSIIDDFYYSRSFGSHLLKGFTAPLTIVNPWFYEGLYDSLEDDSTPGYVAEHLFYISPWIAASAIYAASTGVVLTPFHTWTGATTILRAMAADAGLGTAIAPVAAITAAVATDALFSDAVIHSESLSNVQKSIALGTLTNVPYF